MNVLAWLVALWRALRDAPHCTGPCDGGRKPCKCATGRLDITENR